jgi:hypothetical protein
MPQCHRGLHAHSCEGKCIALCYTLCAAVLHCTCPVCHTSHLTHPSPTPPLPQRLLAGNKVSAVSGSRGDTLCMLTCVGGAAGAEADAGGRGGHLRHRWSGICRCCRCGSCKEGTIAAPRNTVTLVLILRVLECSVRHAMSSHGTFMSGRGTICACQGVWHDMCQLRACEGMVHGTW